MQSALTAVAYETGQYVTAYTKTGIDEEAELAFNMVYRLITNLNGDDTGNETDLFQYDKPVSTFFVSVLKQSVQSGVANVVFRDMIQKYLVSNGNAEKTLLTGRVVNGLNGLDFSDSEVLSDRRTIKLVMSYKIQPEIKIGNITQFNMQNIAMILPWQEGQNAYSETGAFSAWVDLKPIERGNYIMEQEVAQIFHENKDKEIIVLNGKAFKVGVLRDHENIFQEIVNIRSIDFSLASYQNEDVFLETIMNEIDEVSLPERYIDVLSRRMIRMDGNTKRIMILVLPEGKANLNKGLNLCYEYAIEQGVHFEVKYAYGRPMYEMGKFKKGESEDATNGKPIHENNTDMVH